VSHHKKQTQHGHHHQGQHRLIVGVLPAQRARIHAAIHTEGMRKINALEFGDLTRADVQETCHAMCHGEHEDKLTLCEFELLMMHALEPGVSDRENQALSEVIFADEAGDATTTRKRTLGMMKEGQEEKSALKDVESASFVDVEIVFKALTCREFTKLREHHGTCYDIERDWMQDYIERIVDRDDAFMDFPITIFLLSVFLAMVIRGLRIEERHFTELSLEAWTNGKDPRKSCQNNVDSVESFWEWVLEEGLKAPLGHPKPSAVGPGTYEQFHMAGRFVLIGDVLLRKKTGNATDEMEWLLNSKTGADYLDANPGQFLQASLASARHLQLNGWMDRNTEEIVFKTITFSESLKMFATTSLTVKFGDFGDVWPVINTDTMSVVPYPDYDLYVWKAIFTLIMLRTMKNELLSMWSFLRHGCGEFMDYWEFWNYIDWANIMFGLLCIGALLRAASLMEDEEFKKLFDDKFILNVDVMKLDIAYLNLLEEKLVNLNSALGHVNWAFTIAVLTIVLKFFKAFGANMRLRVVTDTFARGSTDFLHFLVIFTAIFLPYGVVGHVLFGADIGEFSSIYSSINACGLLLMGDFPWFVERMSEDADGYLESGMPKVVLFIWYVSYMFLLFLVLMNMLLAIVMKHYLDEAEQIRAMNVYDDNEQLVEETPTMKNQFRDYKRFRDATKGFISLGDIASDLGNDDEPAHPQKFVTEETLQEAFPTMSPEQAQWLLKTFGEELAKEDGAAVDNSAVYALQLLEEQVELVREICGVVQEGASKNKGKKTKKGPDLALVTKGMKGLADDLDVLQKGQFNLAKRVQDIGVHACGASFKSVPKKKVQK